MVRVTLIAALIVVPGTFIEVDMTKIAPETHEKFEISGVRTCACVMRSLRVRDRRVSSQDRQRYPVT
jgi:hypothetical protein